MDEAIVNQELESTQTVQTNEALEQLEQVPDSKHSPSDIAAAFFSMNERKLRNCLKRLSVRQMRRVMLSVASYPLKGEYAPKTDIEKSAAYIFNEMCFNRSIMQLEMEAQRVEQAQKEELEQIKNSEISISSKSSESDIVYDQENVTRPKEPSYTLYQQKLQIEKEENNG